jgi:hypothetical protein
VKSDNANELSFCCGCHDDDIVISNSYGNIY